MKPMTAVHALWFAGVLMSGTPVFAAESTALQTQVQQTDTLTARHGATRVESRIAGDFTAFAGSEANAQSLVTGLRNGTPVTLTGTSSTGGTSTTTLTFDTPTRPMGYGNVHIGLSLAKQQLASYGITNPTPEQLQAALTGGSITTSSGQTMTLNGVLTQRADGMGWGQIAQSQGVKLGQVIGGLKSANASIASGAAASTTTTSASGGVTTASGTRVQASSAASMDAARGNSANAPGHNRSTATAGSGIVTATGGRAAVGVGAGAGANAGAGGGQGAGIVTGAGTSASVQGGARGALMGKGQGKP
jgi:hypothetical protein